MRIRNPSIREKIRAACLAFNFAFNADKKMTMILLLLILFSGFIGIILPYVFQIIIDTIISGKDFSIMNGITIGIIGFLIVYMILRIVQKLLQNLRRIMIKLYSQKIELYTSSALMEKISSLDAAYFENPQYHEVLQKAKSSLWQIPNFMFESSSLLIQFVNTVLILILLLNFNWITAALILLSTLPILLIGIETSKLQWGAYSSTSPINRKASYYNHLLTRDITTIMEIKLFKLKEYFMNKYRKLLMKNYDKQLNLAKNEFRNFMLINVIETIFTALAAWIVINEYLNGKITIGQFTFYWSLVFQMIGYAGSLVEQIYTLDYEASYLTPMLKLMELKNLIKEPKKPKPFPKKLKHGIEFKNVTFYYPGSKKPVLENFNLFIKAGENIALVGENGAGKTTIVKLLLRMYDVNSGEILIDGINIKEFSKDDLYKNMGVIFQDFKRYEATVEENIWYGDVERGIEYREIHEAAEKSGAWDFVKYLPKKYKTHLGKTLKKEGTEISVGQWQKISLARAFYRNAQILCLDEPTASMDAKSEYLLFQKFKELTKSKTTILISHRFSTVKMADKIFLIERGKIIESGNHAELMKMKGKYAKFYNMQKSAFD
ncbi:MAG: ABC transporter ATP-binding protein [Candidatus Micrarchaeia archaeon]